MAHPYAWNGRNAKAGSLRLEGAIHGSRVQTDLLPQLPIPLGNEGDAAVLVPEVALDAAANVALTNGLEIGLRGSYASYDWAEASAVGTMPLPSSPAMYGFGPELRGTIWFGEERRFGLGIGGSVLSYHISTALWEQDPGCTAPDTCVDTNDNLGTDRWRLVEEDARNPLTWNFALYPSYAFGPEGKYGHVFGGPSMHSAYENDGFTDTAEGPPVEGAGFVTFMGAGYGVSIEAVRLAAQAAYPLTSSDAPVSYGFPSFFVTVGVDLSLWGGGDAAAPVPAPATAAPAAAP